MAANSRVASAVQILCVMGHLGEETTSERIARSLRTNPVVVRRLLKALERAELVSLRPGKDGGVRLLRAPDEITLDQVYRAVETETEVFALRRDGNPNCPVNRGMRRLLGPIFAAAGDAVETVLHGETIGGLLRAIR